jgi:hypothetical protein
MTSGVATGRKAMLEQGGEIRLLIGCVRNKAHTKLLSIDPSLGMEWAETLAELLVGTSRFYVHKVGPLSPIGKCGVCGGQLKFEIEERRPENAEHEEPGGDAVGGQIPA